MICRVCPFGTQSTSSALLGLERLARAQKGSQTRGAQILEPGQVDDQGSGLAARHSKTLVFKFSGGFRIEPARRRQDLGVTHLRNEDFHGRDYHPTERRVNKLGGAQDSECHRTAKYPNL